MKLSYSSLRLYQECAKKFEYHYRYGLREQTKNGALLFGSAFDRAVGEDLLALKENRPSKSLEIFEREWETQEINGIAVKLIDSPLVVYSSSDFDSEILTETDKQYIQAKQKELFGPSEESWLEKLRECESHKKQKAFKKWSECEQKFLNICNWLSLRQKGHLFLKAHSEKILPQIKEVKCVQYEISLSNNVGDSLLGFVDAILTLSDGRNVLFDYKTSSLEYEPDSVRRSPQLAIYSHATGIKTCGYIVFRKGIIKNKIKICKKCNYNGSGKSHITCPNEIEGKRCKGEWTETIRPEVDVQIIIDDIPTRTEDIVLENIEASNNGIKNEIFTRNFESCVKPYGRCQFYNLCYYGKDDALVVLPNAKKKV